MISYDEAMEIISKLGPYAACMGKSTRTLAEARGHLLAEDLRAPHASPPFTNSAMDGFAFEYEACKGREDDEGFEILSTILAKPIAQGEIPAQKPGGVVRIMTGAVMPEWADTVIPVEQTETAGERVRFKELPQKGAHVRRRGEDLPAGEILLKKGTRLDAERLMIAAAFGLATLPVFTLPRLRIFCTGDELVQPGEPLVPGTLYNSSRTYLEAAALDAGLEDIASAWIPDDETVASRAIGEALAEDAPTLILTTGAVSAGERDFVPGLAREMGFRPLIHKVAIRPGKPVFLAVHKDGPERGLWLGLPGNAVSTCVGWHAFVRPLLTTWAGLTPPRKRKVSLRHPVHKPVSLRCFYRAELSGDTAWVAPEQGSARLAATIGAEAYVELPEGRELVPADTVVTAIII